MEFELFDVCSGVELLGIGWEVSTVLCRLCTSVCLMLVGEISTFFEMYGVGCVPHSRSG